MVSIRIRVIIYGRKESGVGLVGWPIVDGSPQSTNHINWAQVLSGKGKSASQRLTYLLLSYDANLGLYGFVAPFRPIIINVAVCLLNVLMSLAFNNLRVSSIHCTAKAVAVKWTISPDGQCTQYTKYTVMYRVETNVVHLNQWKSITESNRWKLVHLLCHSWTDVHGSIFQSESNLIQMFSTWIQSNSIHKYLVLNRTRRQCATNYRNADFDSQLNRAVVKSS